MEVLTMSHIKIITEKCTGCKLCTGACPFGAISVIDKKASVLENCTLCGVCVSSCKFGAIDFQKDEAEGSSDPSSYKGVWVFAEQRNGIIASVVMELLGEGRKLADTLSVPLSAVLIGAGLTEQAQTLISYGADRVYLVDHESLSRYNDEYYTGIFAQLVRK